MPDIDTMFNSDTVSTLVAQIAAIDDQLDAGASAGVRKIKADLAASAESATPAAKVSAAAIKLGQELDPATQAGFFYGLVKELEAFFATNAAAVVDNLVKQQPEATVVDEATRANLMAERNKALAMYRATLIILEANGEDVSVFGKAPRAKSVNPPKPKIRLLNMFNYTVNNEPIETFAKVAERVGVGNLKALKAHANVGPGSPIPSATWDFKVGDALVVAALKPEMQEAYDKYVAARTKKEAKVAA